MENNQKQTELPFRVFLCEPGNDYCIHYRGEFDWWITIQEDDGKWEATLQCGKCTYYYGSPRSRSFKKIMDKTTALTKDPCDYCTTPEIESETE